MCFSFSHVIYAQYISMVDLLLGNMTACISLIIFGKEKRISVTQRNLLGRQTSVLEKIGKHSRSNFQSGKTNRCHKKRICENSLLKFFFKWYLIYACFCQTLACFVFYLLMILKGFLCAFYTAVKRYVEW